MPRLPKILLLTAFFSVFFASYLGPIVEGDFFWHLRAGQLVWEDGVIASKTQWLGQTMLYLIWKLSGYEGVVFLRAISYTAILGTLFMWMRREGTGLYISLFFLILTARIFLSFPNERPQLFSFILFPIAILLLESLRKAPPERHLLFAPAILLLIIPLWANIHAGFVLGLSSVGIYLLAASISYIRGETPPRKPAILLAAAVIPALVLLLLSPQSFSLMPGALKSIISPLPYMRGVVEYLSPFSAFKHLGQYYPSFWIFLAAAIFISVKNIRRMPLEHTLLLILFSALSLRFLRFMPFLLMLAPFVAARIKEDRAWGESKAVFAGFSAVFVLWLFLMPIHIWPGVSAEFPEGAVRFLSEKTAKGKIFNYHGWAGYIAWRLPETDLFIPIEGVSEETDEAYKKIIMAEAAPSYGKPLWRAYMDAYALDAVLIPGISPVSGEIYPLIDALLKDGAWHLIYSDDVSNIFIKDSLDAGLIKSHSMPKEKVYLQIKGQALRRLKEDSGNAAFKRSLSVASGKMP